MKFKYLLIPLLFFSLHAPGQSWLWGSGGKIVGSRAFGEGLSVATDLKGNNYLTGFMRDTLIFGNDTLKWPGGLGVAFLVKYNSTGNLLWAKQAYGTNTNSEWINSEAVATDMNGNAYITGAYTDTAIFDKDSLFGMNKCFLAKYDPYGDVVWVRNVSYGEWAVTTDKLGNVYTVGGSCIEKFDSNGNVKWITMGRPVYGTSYGVAANDKGNVFISGWFTDSLSFGPYHLYAQPTGGSGYIAKYDSNGNLLWATQAVTKKGMNQTINNRVATDKDDNSYLVGTFIDSISFGGHNLYGIDTGTSIYLVKYSPNGKVIWAKQGKNVDSNYWFGYSITTDTLNHIYVSGGANFTNAYCTNCNPFRIAFNADTFSIYYPYPYNESANVAIIAKFDSSGSLECGELVRGGGLTFNTVCVTPNSNNVYLGGYLNDTLTFAKNLLGGTVNGNFIWPFVASWLPCEKTEGITVIPIENDNTYLFPNPNNGIFTILSSNETSKSTIDIYNILGEQIYSTFLNMTQGEGFRIDIGSQPSSIYLYRIISKEGIPIASGKFVVE